MVLWNDSLIDVVLHDEDRWVLVGGSKLLVATESPTSKRSDRLRSLIMLYAFLFLSFVARVALLMKDRPRSHPLCHVNIRALGSILNQDVHNVSGLLYHTETKLNSCIRARSRTRYISDEPYSSRYGLRALPFFSCKRQNKLKPLCPNHVPPEEP
jgi:hypothetical protein